MLRHHFSIKPGYQNIRMLSHKTWGCSYMQHGDVVHEYIPMFYIRTSGCCCIKHGDVVIQNMGMFWKLNSGTELTGMIDC